MKMKDYLSGFVSRQNIENFIKKFIKTNIKIS